jgi:AcrR family transcriptional regulator
MDESKLALLEKVSAVYMKFGIKSITMDDLARELGISKKTIYKYFKDKDDLVVSIMDMKVELDKAICLNAQQNSDNAIEGLISLSELVIEQLKNVNPTVFYDLKKHFPEACEVLEKHKWNFVYSIIKENIDRGIQEGFYFSTLKSDIVAKLYISSMDVIMNTDIFAWPDFKFHDVYNEMIRFQLRGLINENGRDYLKQSNYTYEN